MQQQQVLPSPLTTSFFGGSAAVPVEALCRPLTVNDVPPTEEGLRVLAAAGRWNAVAALAERLEGQRLDAVTMYPTESSLRCSLVRVQAYLKLQMFERAKGVFDTLGNFSDSRFCAQATPDRTAVGDVGSPTPPPGAMLLKNSSRRSVVPFSLWFLQAQMPMLCGQLVESQTKLYELLDRCEASQKTSATWGAGERMLWRQRTRRVRRALVANHFELEQFGPAFAMQRDLADTETNELQHLLAMQTLGCMCLRSGNSALATEVFRTIERMQVDDESYDAETNATLASAKEVMVALNHALLLSFHGYFNEACATLRNVMSGVVATPTTTAAVSPASPSHAAAVSLPSSTSSAAARDEALATKQQMRRYAATSLAVCLPFLHRNDNPEMPPTQTLHPSVSIPVISASPMASSPLGGQAATAEQQHPLSPAAAAVPPPTPPLPRTSVRSLLAFLDDQIRTDPKGLLSLDAFMFNYHRLADLENATPVTATGGATGGAVSSSRVDVVEALSEQFRGWRDAHR
jgi:hypothetical protein